MSKIFDRLDYMIKLDLKLLILVNNKAFKLV